MDIPAPGGVPVRKSARSRRAPGDAESTAGSSATATVDAPPKPAGTPPRPRTAAAERAYARRAHREGRGTVARAAGATDEEAAAGRASFVMLIIALLAVGVAATLWLTTQAVADSYRLEDAKEEANRLSEHAAQLQREVTKNESASVLAERARQLGMVPAGDPARIVVGDDGVVSVVGDPKPVRAPAPPAPPAPEIGVPVPVAGDPAADPAAAGTPAAADPGAAIPGAVDAGAGAPGAGAPGAAGAPVAGGPPPPADGAQPLPGGAAVPAPGGG